MMTTPEIFLDYFRKNYSGPHTIISQPDWHARKIYRAAIAASRLMDTLAAAKFALSVLKANPIELSEQMAIDKLEAAIRAAERQLNGN